jgi:hypothetical protein
MLKFHCIIIITIFILLSLISFLSCGCSQWDGKLTKADKKLIVSEHNNYRNQVALQLNSLGPKLPFAKNMLQMYWSKEIAKKARNWANNCKFEHSPGDFRKLSEFSAGENLYVTMQSGKFQSMDWKKAISSWYDEIKDFPSDRVKKFNSGGPMIGHFTQVIWAKTYLIGCGFAQYKEDGWYKGLYVCQYGPAGNMLDSEIYQTSAKKGCSCPKDCSCSNKSFPGLCCPNSKCTKKSLTYNGPVIS